MADYMIKGETLTNIANAIRAKSGSSATMTPEQMSTEIENISVGGGDIDGLIDGSFEGDITSNVTKLRSYALYKCADLTSVNFPNVTNIGEYAFGECSTLATVNIPKATVIEKNAFYKCDTLTVAYFPLVTSIGNYAFGSCKTLTAIYSPLITSIGTSIFASNFNLTVAYFPLVTSIGNSAFYSCYSLTKVIIGTNTETISALSKTSAFDKCYHILGTAEATYNPEGLKDGFIYVPNTLVADYRTATNWSTYASQIFPWVATVEELANIDGTTYDYACVGEGLGSVEYHYNGTTWEVFR